MKTQITFQDSFDESKISISLCPKKKNYIISIREEQVWFSPTDLEEFIEEVQRFHLSRTTVSDYKEKVISD